MQYWLLPESAPIEDYQQLLSEIKALETELTPRALVTTIHDAANDFHATTGHCPFCRQRGPLHLSPIEEDTTHGPEA